MIDKQIEKELEMDMQFQHIPYKDKIQRWYEELLSTNPDDIMSWGFLEWDKLLWWIYGWKIIVIGAETGVWKSTWVNAICNNVSNQWFRVVKYSLEDRMEDIAKEELYYTCNRIRYSQEKYPYNWVDFVNGKYRDQEFIECIDEAKKILTEKTNLIELDKNRQVSVDDLLYLMERECDEWTKLFAIDHLHYFDMSQWEDRHDLKIQGIMHQLNELARKRNVAIILVAHYKKNKAFGQLDIPSYDDFKDGSAIKQVANIIIQITRDIEESKSSFHITKMRWPIKPKVLSADFNIKTFEYEFEKTDEQKNADRNFI